MTSPPPIPVKPSSLATYTPPQTYSSTEHDDPFADQIGSVPLKKVSGNGYSSFVDDEAYYNQSIGKDVESGATKSKKCCPWPWWGYLLLSLGLLAAIIGFSVLGVKTAQANSVDNVVASPSTTPSSVVSDSTGISQATLPATIRTSSLVQSTQSLQSMQATPSASPLASASSTVYTAYTPSADAYIKPFVLGSKAFPTTNPAKDFSVTLGEFGDVGPLLGDYGASFMHTVPDCFTPSLPSATKPGEWMFIYSEAENRRSLGPKPFPENQRYFEPSSGGGWPITIFGGRNESDPSILNGGAWLMSVHRNPSLGGTNLIGFWHSQDHIFKNGITNAAGEAWKSIGVAYSDDDGVTWKLPKSLDEKVPDGVILEGVGMKPDDPAYGGIGDHAVMWDWKQQHWVCLFKEQLRIGVAISKDAEAKPGSWYKYRGSPQQVVPNWVETQPREWNGDGIGGSWTPLPDLYSVPGANPGCHWNTHLEKWICIWNTWNDTKISPDYVPNSLYISQSDDLLNWDIPKLLVTPKCPSSKAWHATVISAEGGSDWGGRDATLYYSDCWTSDTKEGRYADGRLWVSRSVRFDRV